MNVALGAATQWLFNFVVAQAVPRMLATVGKGGYGTYFIFGSFSFAMFVFVWFFIPETKGISLERMDELFGAVQDPKLSGEEASIRSASHSADQKTDVITQEKVERK
jgi:hypothetical protein